MVANPNVGEASQNLQPQPIEIFKRHAWDGAHVDNWLEWAGCDPEAVRGATTLGESRGRFTLYAGRKSPCFSFEPQAAGRDRAILMPVFEGGEVVDLLAVSKANMNVWGPVGCVGRAAGYDQIGASREPLPVHREVWDWLLSGCQGVLPLCEAGYAELARSPALLALDFLHAEELSERSFELPTWYRAGSTANDVTNAVLDARDRIFVDDYDDVIAARAANIAARNALESVQ